MKYTRAIALPLSALAFALLALPAHADEPGEAQAIVLDDFADAAAAEERWMTVNDNVMGGRSTGGPEFADGLLTFSGSTNTNGGGFSSIRTRPADHDLTGNAGLLIRVRGDGRTYKASLRTDVTNGRWQIPFRADFDTVEGQWLEVFIPFEDFTPTFMGREIRDNAPVLDLAEVQSMGFMIYDKQDGPFQLEVDWVQAVAEVPASTE